MLGPEFSYRIPRKHARTGFYRALEATKKRGTKFLNYSQGFPYAELQVRCAISTQGETPRVAVPEGINLDNRHHARRAGGAITTNTEAVLQQTMWWQYSVERCFACILLTENGGCIQHAKDKKNFYG